MASQAEAPKVIEIKSSNQGTSAFGKGVLLIVDPANHRDGLIKLVLGKSLVPYSGYRRLIRVPGNDYPSMYQKLKSGLRLKRDQLTILERLRTPYGNVIS